MKCYFTFDEFGDEGAGDTTETTDELVDIPVDLGTGPFMIDPHHVVTLMNQRLQAASIGGSVTAGGSCSEDFAIEAKAYPEQRDEFERILAEVLQQLGVMEVLRAREKAPLN